MVSGNCLFNGALRSTDNKTNGGVLRALRFADSKANGEELCALPISVKKSRTRHTRHIRPTSSFQSAEHYGWQSAWHGDRIVAGKMI